MGKYRRQRQTLHSQCTRANWAHAAGLPLILILGVAIPLSAASPAHLVEEGNRAYESGEYAAALEAYEKAAVDAPESPEIAFNRGTVFYRQQDYDKAEEAFREAALKTRDVRLEAKAKYNLGNVAFRRSERQRDSDLQKALQACEKSIAHYREALELDPELQMAGRNLEIARLTMKSLLDEIRKQQEEAQKRKQQQQQAQQKLKEIAEKQQKLRRDTEKLDGSPRTPQEKQEAARELADRQNKLRRETEEMKQKLEQASKQQPQDPAANSAKKELQTAVTEQDKAEKQLDSGGTRTAADSQEEAEKALKKALEALSGDEKERQQQQQQADADQTQEEDAGKEKQAARDRENSQAEAEEDQQQTKKTAVKLDDDARDILNEEKENSERRQVGRMRGYSDVDKDW